jgi:thioredoxin reductase (NADPH)
VHFAPVSKTVNIVVRGPGLKETISKYLLDRVQAASNGRVSTNSEVTELEGDEILQAIFITNRLTGERQRFVTRWLFVCIGSDPRTTWSEARVDRLSGDWTRFDARLSDAASMAA